MNRPNRTAPAPATWLPDARRAIAEQGERTPESRPWLGLLDVALTAAAGPDLAAIDVRLADGRPADAPVLEGARIGMDATAAAELVDALLRAVPAETETRAAAPGSSAPPARAPVDAPGIIEAGLRQDRAALDRIAAPGPWDGGTLATVAHFASLPLLLEAGSRAAERIPSGWRAGYCPVCAAWPTLVELRGLERRRVLRCGRCATGWERDVLHCPFCGERDHRRQGALVPGDAAELVRVETCASCRGYVKSVTTLRPAPAWALPLEDLRTLELDLSALERGFRRPDHVGWNLHVGLAARDTARAVAGRDPRP